MKRLIDVLLSGLGLIILSPLFIIIGILIKLDSKGPIIFKQNRVGKAEKVFTLYKFRTMKTGTPHVATHLLENPDAMITRAGHFLRKTSLDELPQLVNVIKGDMSLVGPRPALYNQYDLISGRRDKGINNLRPGITGWAQINGRDEIMTDEKILVDYYYLEHKSAFLDLQILIKTFKKVYSAEGIKEGTISKKN